MNDTEDRKDAKRRSQAHEQEMDFILRVLEVADRLVSQGRPPETTLGRVREIVRRRPLPADPIDRSAVKAERSVMYALISQALEKPGHPRPTEWAMQVYERRRLGRES